MKRRDFIIAVAAALPAFGWAAHRGTSDATNISSRTLADIADAGREDRRTAHFVDDDEQGAVRMVDQGTQWTRVVRHFFYSQDQGSQLIPLFWLAALNQPNGKPFLENSLSRYGYLPNPASPTPGLPTRVDYTMSFAQNHTQVTGTRVLTTFPPQLIEP